MRVIILIIFLIAPIAQPTNTQVSLEFNTSKNIEEKLDSFNKDIQELIYEINHANL